MASSRIWCDAMLQNYYTFDLFQVSVQVSGCNDDYEDETEIYIGLVPISTLVQQYVHPLQSDLPNAPIPQGVPNIHPPMQNAPAYPNNASVTNIGFPNVNAGYPNSSPSNNIHGIPLGPMSHSNIGFIIPPTSPGNAPYMQYSSFTPSAPPS